MPFAFLHLKFFPCISDITEPNYIFAYYIKTSAITITIYFSAFSFLFKWTFPEDILTIEYLFIISNKRNLDCSSCDRETYFDKRTVDETSNNNNDVHFCALESKEMKRHWVRMFFSIFLWNILFLFPRIKWNFSFKIPRLIINYFFFFFLTKKNETSTGKNTTIRTLKKQVLLLKLFAVVGKSSFFHRPTSVYKTVDPFVYSYLASILPFIHLFIIIYFMLLRDKYVSLSL